MIKITEEWRCLLISAVNVQYPLKYISSPLNILKFFKKEVGRGGVRQNTTVLYPNFYADDDVSATMGYLQVTEMHIQDIGPTTYTLQSSLMHHL